MRILVLSFVLCTFIIETRTEFKLDVQCFCSSSVLQHGTCNWSQEIITSFGGASKAGTLLFTLPNLRSCHVNNYKIALLVNETITNKTECHNWKEMSLRYIAKHSQIWYNRENESVCDCSNALTARFNYVFTGCYILQISNGKGRVLYNSMQTFIETDYIKETLMERTCLDTQFTSRNTTVRMLLEMTQLDKPPNITGSVHSLQNDTEVSIPLQSVQVGRTKVPLKCHCSTASSKTSDCRPDESKHHSSKLIIYTWKYANLSSGNYNFVYEFENEPTRCNMGTIWGNCRRQYYFTVPNITQPNIIKERHENSFDTITMICCASIVIFLIIFMLVYPKFMKRCFGGKNGFEILRPNDSEILLVYARDCEEFMVVIEKFKGLLRSCVPQARIYDLNTENFNASPKDWVNDKLSRNNVKIVLFIYNCGIQIYNGQMQDPYKDPRYQDNLFYSVIEKLILTNARRPKEVFVVQLETAYDTTIFEDLNLSLHQNPFVVPKMIRKLLKKMFGVSGKFDNLLLNDFEEHCSMCDEFCKEHLRYTENILQYISY